MIIEYRGKRPHIAASAFIAPTAVIIGDVEIAAEASIWFGTVLRGDFGPIRIGARTSVQDNAVIHVSDRAETIVGDDVTIGHGAILEDCTIEPGTLIGSNSVILNGARIGSGTLIAAGSVVIENAVIPPGVLAAGNPATVKRPIDERLSRWMDDPSSEYVHLSRNYLRLGIGDPEMHELIASTARAGIDDDAPAMLNEQRSW